MATPFTFTQDDTRPFFAVIVKDSLTNTVVDLTSASAVFYMKSKYLVGQSAGTPKVNGVAMVITSAVGGELEYRWSSGDLSVPGVYTAAIKITHSDTKVQTIIIEDVVVLPKLA